VLLIADLEGISGVDSLDALLEGAPGYEAAAAAMTREVALVAKRLEARGVESIVVSDAHRSGADTNLGALPATCEVRVEHDMYGGALLDDVEAICCVGMHAGGASEGFGAHTVSLNTEWRVGEQLLTETHVAQWLAAERGIPLLFSSGDQVLKAQLGPPIPFVQTKVSSGRGETRSFPKADFAAVMTKAPAPLPKVPRAPLQLRFQTRAEADAAAEAGGRRITNTVLELEPRDTFQAQYDEALALIDASESALLARIHGDPGTEAFLRNAARLLLDPWEG
jgi:D-amino peptidase